MYTDDAAGGPTDDATATSDAASTGSEGDEPPWVVLFEGELTDDWQMSTISNQPGQDDPGTFVVEDGALVSVTGTDLGLLWNMRPTPPDFELELQWARTGLDDNSGVFIRFPDPGSKGYDNTAWVAIDFGFEVQIDETGAPDGSPIHTTGAIYGEEGQTLSPTPALPLGEWNTYSIRVEGQTYTVNLNGQQVTVFANPHPDRGLPTTNDAPSFIGLQTHTGAVRFRNIRIRAL
jgi:hypothetical protein